MKYHHTRYAYRKKFPRTSNWWSGDWAKLSDWCDEIYGIGEWEYINESFAFLRAKDLTMFLLRWS
jgi:hypothetical protein